MLYSKWVRFSSLVGAISERLGDLSGALILFMAASTTYDVCMRYLFNKPSIWVVEVSGFMLAAVACLGACYTLKLRRHVAVDLLVDRLPPEIKERLGIATSIIALLTSILLCILSFNLWHEAFTTGERTWTTLRAPLGFLYSYFFIGMLVLSVQYLVNIVEDIAKICIMKNRRDNENIIE